MAQAPVNDVTNVDDVIQFFDGIPKLLGVLNDSVQQDWQSIGQQLMRWVTGTGSSADGSLDALLAGIGTWQGAAADEFRAKAQIVRQFALAAAANAYNQVNLMVDSQLPANQQTPQADKWHLTSGRDYDGVLFQTQSGLQDAQKALGDLSKNFDIWTGWVNWVLRSAVDEYHNHCHGTNTAGTPANFSAPVWNFKEFLTNPPKGAVTPTFTWNGSNFTMDQAPQSGSSRLVVSFQGNGWTTHSAVDYYSQVVTSGVPFHKHFEFDWNTFSWDNAKQDGINQNSIRDNFRKPELYNAAGPIFEQLGKYYDTIQPPDPVDDSQLPKGATNTQTNWPPDPGPGPGPFGGGPFNQSGGTSPYSASQLGKPGAFAPTGLHNSGSPFSGANLKSGTDPFGLTGPHSGTGGVVHPFSGAGPHGGGAGPGLHPGGTDPWGGGDPSKLADFNPNAAGGLFTPGADGALTGGGAGGLGTGALGAGTGAGGAGAGNAAGLAGRGGMPGGMPGGGAGGGKDDKSRSRNAWLMEDESVWTGGDEGSPAVL